MCPAKLARDGNSSDDFQMSDANMVDHPNDDEPGDNRDGSETFDEEGDPVVAEYDVFITPPSENKLYVLQFIGRPKDTLFTGHDAPLEVRMKPETGFIEVDVPLYVHNDDYDRQKGVKFGEALRKTKQNGQTAYGAAAGFQKVMPRSTKRRDAEDADDAEDDDDDDDAPAPAVDEDQIADYVKNFDDASDKGHVLNTVTWSGRILQRDPNSPNYMIGVFRNNEVHLTLLDGIVQLYPQIHHIDALAHLDAASRRKEPGDAKSVVPTLKKSVEESPVIDFLKKTAAESWQKMVWNDCNSDAAFEGFSKRLFLEDTKNAQIIEFESKEDFVERVLPVVVGTKQSVVLSDSEDEDEVNAVPDHTSIVT